jgi:hypothetical protein
MKFVTTESRPSKINIKKKRIDQNGAAGSVVTA